MSIKANIEVLSEISDFNLQYLFLAKKMIEDDIEKAMFRLGIKKDIAEMIMCMTTSQILKLAAQDRVLCSFLIDDSVMLKLFVENSRAKEEVFSHAKILLTEKNRVTC